MKLKVLIGSGDKIGLFTLPFLMIGIALNVIFPSFFSVGGPPAALQVLSVILLLPGLIIWIWSIILILARVPKEKLITDGPYHLVKHPLYTSVALLVLPWTGFLFNSWLGAFIGLVLYVGSRIYSRKEEEMLSKMFFTEWDYYCKSVKMPWL